MKKFRVLAACTSYCYIDVVACNLSESMHIAEDLDGGLFTPTGDGDWCIISASELKEVNNEQSCNTGNN